MYFIFMAIDVGRDLVSMDFKFYSPTEQIDRKMLTGIVTRGRGYKWFIMGGLQTYLRRL